MTDEERERFLVACTNCNMPANRSCGRAVDKRNGDIYPIRDTGFRMPVKQVRERIHLIESSYEKAGKEETSKQKAAEVSISS